MGVAFIKPKQVSKYSGLCHLLGSVRWGKTCYIISVRNKPPGDGYSNGLFTYSYMDYFIPWTIHMDYLIR